MSEVPVGGLQVAGWTTQGQATGRWRVTFKDMPLGGVAFVSGLGDAALRCRITSIRTSGSPATVGVACRNAAGAYANGPFALAFLAHPPE